MLVLKRCVSGVIVIRPPGLPPIRVVLAEAGRGWARIGVEADPSVVVDREEVDRRKALHRACRGEGTVPS